MGRYRKIQSTLNAGVLDPRLAARIDVKQYYDGMLTGQNVVVLPQGGARRRGGFLHIDNLDGFGRLVPFEFNTEQTYLIVLVDKSIRIYKDDVLQTTVVSPFLESELRELDHDQSADTLILTHTNHAPQRLLRGASDTSWTLDAVPLENIPQFSFNDTEAPASTDDVQLFTFGGTWLDGELFRLAVRGKITENIFYSSIDDKIKERIRLALERAISVPQQSVTSGITVGGSLPNLSVTFSGDYAGLNDLVYVNTNDSAAGTLTPTIDTAGTGEPLEDVWSDTRGWPRCVAFHEARLFFGGSTQRPQTLWGSVSFSPFNFDFGDGFDDEAISTTLDTGEINAITAIVSSRFLQVMTAGGEFYLPTSPITPQTAIDARLQTSDGSKRIQPALIDGATIFIQRSGKVIREFLFSFVDDSFSSKSISSLAPHLIRNPLSIATRRSTSSDDAAYIHLVNEDGSVAVLATLRSQEVAGYTEWLTTDGTFSDMAVLGNESELLGLDFREDVYAITQRPGIGTKEYRIEKLNDEGYTDASLQFSGDYSTLTGLDHLSGATVYVRDATHNVVGEFTLGISDTTLDLGQTVTDPEVGIDFAPIIQLMPPNADIGGGPTLLRRQRISRATVDLQDSLGVEVNGDLIPEFQLDVSQLDTPPTPLTGVREVFIAGWGRKPTITITQNGPLPMTILGVEMKVVTE